ncbi:hybrid signal transduction histidine kinase L-like isoform X2 [Prorops nasuta]|uniref:hybrid signal transduction histidine kinase L-like isoform X2 n=1 Tax=Prorops nasuta TaxID=863751 RepID=UPI0034CE2B0F
MPRKENTKAKTWERDRRKRMNGYFKTLADLLPPHQDGRKRNKVDILIHASKYIKELHSRMEDILLAHSSDVHKEELVRLKRLVAQLFSRTRLLSTLLKEAGITIPAEPAFEKISPLKWSNKINLDESDNHRSDSLDGKSKVPSKKNVQVRRASCKSLQDEGSIGDSANGSIENQENRVNGVASQEEGSDNPVGTVHQTLKEKNNRTPDTPAISNSRIDEVVDENGDLGKKKLDSQKNSRIGRKCKRKERKKPSSSSAAKTSTNATSNALILSGGKLMPLVAPITPLTSNIIVTTRQQQSIRPIILNDNQQSRMIVMQPLSSHAQTSLLPVQAQSLAGGIQKVTLNTVPSIGGSVIVDSQNWASNIKSMIRATKIGGLKGILPKGKEVTKTTMAYKVPISAIHKDKPRKDCDAKNKSAKSQAGKNPKNKTTNRSIEKLDGNAGDRSERTVASKGKTAPKRNTTSESNDNEDPGQSKRRKKEDNDDDANGKQSHTNDTTLPSTDCASSIEGLQRVVKKIGEASDREDSSKSAETEKKPDGEDGEARRKDLDKRKESPVPVEASLTESTSDDLVDKTKQTESKENEKSSSQLDRLGVGTSKENAETNNRTTNSGNNGSRILLNLDTNMTTTMKPNRESSSVSAMAVVDTVVGDSSKVTPASKPLTYPVDNTFVPINNSSNNSTNNNNNNNRPEGLHSDLSNDIFASLQVPSSSHNPESISPTAAFLMAFPLVSSLNGKTEVLEEEIKDDQFKYTSQTPPLLLQIGAIEPNSFRIKSAMSPNARGGIAEKSLKVDREQRKETNKALPKVLQEEKLKEPYKLIETARTWNANDDRKNSVITTPSANTPTNIMTNAVTTDSPSLDMAAIKIGQNQQKHLQNKNNEDCIPSIDIASSNRLRSSGSRNDIPFDPTGNHARRNCSSKSNRESDRTSSPHGKAGGMDKVKVREEADPKPETKTTVANCSSRDTTKVEAELSRKVYDAKNEKKIGNAVSSFVEYSTSDIATYTAAPTYEVNAIPEDDRKAASTVAANNSANFSVPSWTSNFATVNGHGQSAENSITFDQGPSQSDTMERKRIVENPSNYSAYTSTLSGSAYATTIQDATNNVVEKPKVKHTLDAQQKQSFIDATTKVRNSSSSSSSGTVKAPRTHVQTMEVTSDYLQNDYSSIGDEAQQQGPQETQLIGSKSDSMIQTKLNKTATYPVISYDGGQLNFDLSDNGTQMKYSIDAYTGPNIKYTDRTLQTQEKYQEPCENQSQPDAPQNNANAYPTLDKHAHQQRISSRGKSGQQQQQQQQPQQQQQQHQQHQHQHHTARQPVNWMMTPEIKHNTNISDIILPPIGKELEFCQNNLFGPASSYNQGTCNQFYNNYDATTHGFSTLPVLQNDPKRSSDLFYSEEPPFSWSPTKNVMQNVDQSQAKNIDHILPSTLPTLVGDLALGTNASERQNFLFNQVSLKSQLDQGKDTMKDNGHNIIQHPAQPSSFLSVSQLVDHEKAEKSSQNQHHQHVQHQHLQHQQHLQQQHLHQQPQQQQQHSQQQQNPHLHQHHHHLHHQHHHHNHHHSNQHHQHHQQSYTQSTYNQSQSTISNSNSSSNNNNNNSNNTSQQQHQAQQNQSRRHQRKSNSSPRGNGKRQLDARKQASMNDQLYRRSEEQKMLGHAYSEHNFQPQHQLEQQQQQLRQRQHHHHHHHNPQQQQQQQPQAPQELQQQHQKYQQNISWRNRNCKNNYTAEALIGRNGSVEESINKDKHLSIKLTGNYGETKGETSSMGTGSVTSMNYFSNNDDGSGYGQMVNQSINSYTYCSNANIYPTSNFISSISNSAVGYAMSIPENSDYIEANGFLSSNGSSSVSVAATPSTSIVTSCTSNSAGNANGSVKNEQYSMGKGESLDKRLYSSATRKGKRKALESTAQNVDFSEEFHQNHSSSFLAPPALAPLPSRVRPPPLPLALPPLPPPAPPAPPAAVPTASSTSSAVPQPSETNPLYDNETQGGSTYSKAMSNYTLSGNQGTTSNGFSMGARGGLVGSNYTSMTNHPSGTSLTNFNLSTIFPEMNDKIVGYKGPNEPQTALTGTSGESASYAERSSYPVNSVIDY